MYYHKFQPSVDGLRAEAPRDDGAADMGFRRVTKEALALVPRPRPVPNCSLWTGEEQLYGLRFAFRDTPGWRKPSKLAFYIDEDAPFWATVQGYF